MPYVPLAALLASLFFCWVTAMPSLAGELGPKRLVEALRAQPNEEYYFVVSYSRRAIPDAGLLQGEKAIPIDLLNGVSLPLKVADAFKLAKSAGIDWVWYLHPEEASGTIRALQGIDYTVKTMPMPNLANLSLGPPTKFYRSEPDHDAPIPRALRAAADMGLISVVAVGNVGKHAPGFVNPWSTPPWVISVGAWDHTTGEVWHDSSTAYEDQPDAWPDVVAPGVDVIGPWTTARKKTAERRAYDEANERFRKTVPKEKWDQYTLMTGTSQATAVTSAATAQILRYLNGYIKEHNKSYGDPLFKIEVEAGRVNSHDTMAPRLTGTSTQRADGRVVYAYTLDKPWRLVKQILIDTAIPVKNGEPWKAGAGLVDPTYIAKQFGAYGVEAPKILPVKVQ